MTSVTVQDTYGNRVRVRACGLLTEGESILLVNHAGLTDGAFWSPPGGGIEFGESAAACVRREVAEETGLEIEVGEFLFATEFVRPPLHAVELFFQCRRLGGKLKTGEDPETAGQDLVIQNVRFVRWTEIATMDPQTLHGLFRLVAKPAQVTGLRGYFAV